MWKVKSFREDIWFQGDASSHSGALEVKALTFSIFLSPALLLVLMTSQRFNEISSTEIQYGDDTYRDKDTPLGRRPRRRDVIPCQRETTWRILCIVFVGNRTMSRNLWFSVTLAKNGTMEGEYNYFLSCGSYLIRNNCISSLTSSCVGIEEHQASDIERYHCPECALLHGPLTRK